MRRFGIVFVALTLVLAGFGAIGSAPSVVAQEASPEAMAACCPSPLDPNRRAGGDPGWGGDLRRRQRGRVLRPAGADHVPGRPNLHLRRWQ